MNSLLAIQTPALILDRSRLERNIRRVAAHVDNLGVRLRPHLKTSKSTEIARMLRCAGASGFNVSTLREAEYFYEAGFGDLFYCVPLSPNKASRVARLLDAGCDLRLLAGSAADARRVICAMEAAAPCRAAAFVVEIDVDGYRTGAAWKNGEIVEVARLLERSKATRFIGITSYAGASYFLPKRETQSLVDRHLEALTSCRRMLQDAGVECGVVSFGSTPAVLRSDSLPGVTEVRCGIYAFQDLFQSGIGACSVEDIAISVLCSVVATQPEHKRFAIDAGAIALSKDQSTKGTSFDAAFGVVCDAETGQPIQDLVVDCVSQELGMVTSKSGLKIDYSEFPVGRLLRVLPNHADMTAAAYEKYVVIDQRSEVVADWARVNYWRELEL